MKTEAEIRKHRDNLKAALARPCGCAAEGHARECYLGGVAMAAEIRALSWALGESPEADRFEEHLARAKSAGKL